MLLLSNTTLPQLSWCPWRLILHASFSQMSCDIFGPSVCCTTFRVSCQALLTSKNLFGIALNLCVCLGRISTFPAYSACSSFLSPWLVLSYLCELGSSQGSGLGTNTCSTYAQSLEPWWGDSSGLLRHLEWSPNADCRATAPFLVQ
jgi:hypothetical protein